MDAWLPRPRTASPTPVADDPDDEPPPRGPGGANQGPPLVPIFKLMTPRPLPTRIIE
jgi:hypothetical protein